MYFLNYRLRKALLNQCLKSCVSEDASRDNIGNGSKHCWNLNDSLFTIFINHSEGSCIAKSLF